jgi:RimK family alpha-L-glutamate ligase
VTRPARIAIATGSPGWHGRQLVRAFAALAIDTALVPLPACRVDLEANRWGIVLPGFEEALPDAVVVREISAGSFEQVTLRLGLLHALAAWGVPIYNSARAVERTVDKSATSLLLRQAGIPTPATWVTEGEAQARTIVMRETAGGERVVLKPLFGSQGQGLRRLGRGDELPGAGEVGGVWYLQRFVECGDATPRDYRVFVVAGRAVAAMSRRGPDWVHNVAQGARCEPAALEPELCSLAERATQAVGADYAGVDLMRGPDGRPCVLEVNGIPAWRGLQSVTQVDIALCLARDVRARLGTALRAAAP